MHASIISIPCFKKKGRLTSHHEDIPSATPFVLFPTVVWEAGQEAEGLSFLLLRCKSDVFLHLLLENEKLTQLELLECSDLEHKKRNKRCSQMKQIFSRKLGPGERVKTIRAHLKVGVNTCCGSGFFQEATAAV